jgi:membrane protein DedA with SNARE-associated domain
VDAVDSLFQMYGLAAVFVIMLSKAIGIPIPIPGDVVVLALGAHVAAGKVPLADVFVALLVAIVLGSTLQFLVARGVGRRAVYRFGRYLGMTESRLDAAAQVVKRSGPVGIGVAILTPGVRSVTIPACGLAGLSLAAFLPGLVLGTVASLALHLGIGILGAPVLQALFSAVPLPWLLLVILLAAGLGVWIVLIRRRRGSVLAAVAAWEDATCPVCLALGAAARRH